MFSLLKASNKYSHLQYNEIDGESFQITNQKMYNLIRNFKLLINCIIP